MTRTRYDEKIPVEVLESLAPLVDKWLWLVPTWCHELHVHYEGVIGEEPDAYASNSTVPEYRGARIRVAGSWLERDDRNREEAVVHELLHIPIAPMRCVLLDSVACTDNVPFKELVEENWRIAMEGAVCDLAHSLMEKAA